LAQHELGEPLRSLCPVRRQIEVYMQSFLDAISAFINNYHRTSFTLASFIEDTHKSITELSKVHVRLTDKFKAIPAGAEVELQIEGGKSIGLSAEQMQVVVEAMTMRVESIERYPHMLTNMGFIYLVAIFDAFLTDIFTSVLVNKPEALKSKRQLTYDRILELMSGGDLITFMAHREINELSYKSMEDQAEYYKSKFNINLSDSGVGVSVLTEIRAERNLLVHNNGVVNEIYLETVDSSSLHLGETLNIQYEYWKESRQHLDTVANFVYKSVVDKFAPKDESPTAT